MKTANHKNEPVYLWDKVVRIFHWWLVFVFVANYFVNEPGDKWHEWLGYAAVAALVVRFIWGFVGSGAARWSSFFPFPSRVIHHIRLLKNKQEYEELGHSPLGSVVMIVMMSLFLCLGVTGYMMEEIDRFWGVEWVENVHEWLADILMGLILLHIAAAVIVSVQLRDNLPLSMITGKRKPRP